MRVAIVSDLFLPHMGGLEVVVDRIKINSEIRGRLSQSVEVALHYGSNLLGVYLVDKNAGVLLEEKDLTCESLVNKINELINDPNKCLDIKDNLENIGKKNSATLIYNEIKELTNDK